LLATTYGRVTWFGGSFVRTNARYAGAIYVMDGSMIVTGTRFEECSSGNGGGCVYAERTASINLTGCTMLGCTAAGSGGGAVYVAHTASVRLESCNITKSRSVLYGGGAVAIFQNGKVHMQNCWMEQNQGTTVGGAVVAQGESHFTAVNCMVLNNYCADRGGGLGFIGNASALLTQCLVSGCSAGRGGGMALEDHAVVNLDHCQITRNTAQSSGGGVLLSSDGFDGFQMRAAVLNNQAPAKADVSVVPTHLTNLNSSTMFGYVSRLRADEGLIDVALLVTGPRNMPAVSVEVAAMLEGVRLRRAISGDDGLVHVPVKLLKPPGGLVVSMVCLPSRAALPMPCRHT
jgi:hypothetical protein